MPVLLLGSGHHGNVPSACARRHDKMGLKWIIYQAREGFLLRLRSSSSGIQHTIPRRIEEVVAFRSKEQHDRMFVVCSSTTPDHLTTKAYARMRTDLKAVLRFSSVWFPACLLRQEMQ